MFSQYPYINFKDFNFDWLLKRMKQLAEDVLHINKKVDDFIVETEPTIRDEVDDWLVLHPEVTTTVQDHSLSYEKMINGTLGYVFPKMFGAAGDGTTDDTQAFKDMFAAADEQDLAVIIPNGLYNLTENFFSDDSVVRIDDGTYPNKQPIISKRLKESITPTLYKTFIVTNSKITGAMQGGCYDSTNNRVVIAYAADDTDPALIMAYDPEFTQELAYNIINPTSHFNDLAYNSRTKLIYAPARPTVDTIYIINPDTLQVVDSFTIDFGAIIKRLSYDERNDLYYVQGDDFLKIYDSAFNLLHTVNYSLAQLEADSNMPSGATILMQGSVVYDNQFLYLWTYQNERMIPNILLTQLDYFHSKNKANYEFQSVNGKDEAEAIYTIGNTLYMISAAGKQLHVLKADLTNNTKTNINRQYVDLTDSDDLNTIFTEGVYVCSANATAAAMANCPTGQAFRMYVLSNTSGNYKIQILHTITGEVWLRYYRHDSGLWYDKGFVDWITAKGSLNGWRYKLHSDNTLEAWTSYSAGTISNWTALGNSGLYYSSTIAIPLPLPEGKTVSNYCATAASNNMTYAANITVSGSTLNMYVVASSNQNLNVTVRVMFNCTLTG